MLFVGPGAAISGLSAAYLWGIDQLPLGSFGSFGLLGSLGSLGSSQPFWSPGSLTVAVEVTAPLRVRRVGSPAVRLIRSPLLPGDVTVVGGLPVTTPARTAFDLARRLPRVDAVVAIDAMLSRNVLRLPDLLDYCAVHPGWPGGAQVSVILALIEPGAESPMESRLRLVIVDGGLPRPCAQHEVRDAAGRFVARLDLAYPQWRLGIEYDGDQHRDRAAFRADLTRANALRVSGWTLLRFTASDVWRKPDRIVAQLQAIIPRQ